MSDCLFCTIAERGLPAHVLYEDEKTIAFLDINPVNPGHTLVIPKKHATDIFEIDEAEWNAVMHTVRLVSHALERGVSAHGVNLAMNNRSTAGQTVFHAHVHVIPRFENDGHELWKGKPYAEGEADATLSRIRSSLPHLPR